MSRWRTHLTPLGWTERRGRMALLGAAAFAAALCTAGAVAAQGVPTDGPAMPAQATVQILPRDLSPWGMFTAADWVVKMVMIGLAFASVASWTIGLVKGLEIASARLRLRSGLRRIAPTWTLDDIEGGEAGKGNDPVDVLVAAAIEEGRRSAQQIGRGEVDGVKERIAASLSRIELGASRRLMRGTGVLATVGATAPFVGLFGTVWGIMNAFIGISETQTTNLAVVAPGIAEALLATALGLVAAIPAVVIYNLLARSIAAYRAMLGDASAEVLRLASRDLDSRRLHVAHRQAAE